MLFVSMSYSTLTFIFFHKEILISWVHWTLYFCKHLQSELCLMTCLPRVRAMLGTDLHSLHNIHQKIAFCNLTGLMLLWYINSKASAHIFAKKKERKFILVMFQVFQKEIMFKRQFKKSYYYALTNLTEHLNGTLLCRKLNRFLIITGPELIIIWSDYSSSV